jgi:undecaprenyl diphosphate synthase
MKAVKRAVMAADQMGVKYLTLHAFSTENWKRPKDEVKFLMILPQAFLKTELDELIQNNVQVRMMGDRAGLPSHTLRAIDEAVRRTADHDGLVLNLALNYGSRREITACVKELGRRIEAGSLAPDEISQELIEEHLWSSDLPSPDVVIRTSGEVRLSNFMLWQLAYSEMLFTPIYWPEFSEKHFNEAVAEFQRRIRRYGGHI